MPERSVRQSARVLTSHPPTSVLAAWGREAEVSVRPLGGGRVNETWAVGTPTELVLQHLSNHYFHEPQLVMDNLVRIVGHLEWRQAFDDRQQARWYPELERTEAGRAYHVDGDGNVWRAFRWIEGFVIDKPTAGDQRNTIHSIAHLYGRFLSAVDDLEGVPLAETVPQFRSTTRIVNEFDVAWQQTDAERRSRIVDLRDRALRLTEQLGPDEESLPARVVHNDTKLPNVVLHGNPATARAVIDFDLVMPGLAMNDFGDLYRSAIQFCGSGVDLELFEALATAYVAGCNGVLSESEVMSLANGPKRICTQLAWRYLADSVRDSPVLRVSDSGASLRKADANLRVAEELVGNENSILSVVSRLV